MARLYALLTTMTMAVALITGSIFYELGKTTTYVSSCDFGVTLPVTSQVATSDAFTFNRNAAQDAVDIAAARGATTAVAIGKQAGLDPSLVKAVGVNSISNSAFRVTAKSATSDNSLRITNAACRQYVGEITADQAEAQKREEDAVSARISTLNDQITTLAAPSPALSPASQAAQLEVAKGALKLEEILLSAAISRAPLDVVVTNTAVAAHAETSPRIARDLLIAVVAGLLVSFLLILGIDSVMEWRAGGISRLLGASRTSD